MHDVRKREYTGTMGNTANNQIRRAAYRWTITRDHLADGPEGSDVGTSGPRNCDDSLNTNPGRFVMKDDDGETYYQGMIYGDYDGFEPLDEFGEPNAGCTEIWLDGSQV